MTRLVSWLKGWNLQRKQFKVEKEWRKQTHDAYMKTLGDGSIEAKTVLADLSRAHGLFSPAFDDNPIELARMAGERNVIARILHIINMPPGKAAELLEEGYNDIPMDGYIEGPTDLP